MPNSLTGDFEAILQVSGSTIDRLLATMHQNIGTPKNLPVFPHLDFIQLGDDSIAGGVHGLARIQSSPPRVQLLHGAHDRFVIRVWIRAHFTPDSGSAPFPEFIHGEISAEYRIREEHHPRYGFLIASYVDPANIHFTSAGPDTSWDAIITAEVVRALTTKYPMTPHPLRKDFQERRLRSLVASSGESAVTVPLTLSAPTPMGNMDSIHNVALGGRDLAVVISREYILSLIQPTLDAILASQLKVQVNIDFEWYVPLPDVNITYQVQVTKAVVTWSTGTVPVLNVPGAKLAFEIEGNATTSSILPNASFTVRHDLWLLFDALTETVAIHSAGPPSVSADVNGPFGPYVEPIVENNLRGQLTLYLNKALADAAPSLQQTVARKKALVSQLKSMDDMADAHFDAAEFTPDAAILRGTITVATRKMPQVLLGKLADDSGFTGMPSWIPGGRITEFHWSWFWFAPTPGNIVSGPFTQMHHDRFLLRSAQSLPGLPPVPGTPLPVWGAAGAVCLTIHGFTTDVVTGADVAVTSLGGFRRIAPCLYFYPPSPRPGILVEAENRRLYWRVLTAASNGRKHFKEIAMLDIQGRARDSSSGAANSLIRYYDAPPDAAAIAAFADALGRVQRTDAGLVVVMLLSEGLMSTNGDEIAAALGDLGMRVPGPVLVGDDVGRGWSSALELPDIRGEATRLVAPDGRLEWRADGPVDPDELVAALRENLRPAPPPAWTPIQAALGIGQAAPDFFVDQAGGVQLRRLFGAPIHLSFVQPRSDSSLAQARRLERLHSQERYDSHLIVVVDRADRDEADRFGRANAPSGWTVADPRGTVTDSYGIHVWPTTLLIDESGRIAAVETGTDPGALDMLARA